MVKIIHNLSFVEFNSMQSLFEWMDENKIEQCFGEDGVIVITKMYVLFQIYTASIKNHLDAFAKTRRYDGILSACTYATSSVRKFSAEGQYAVEARDATWTKFYEILADVESGIRPTPHIEEIISELPELAWPEL